MPPRLSLSARQLLYSLLITRYHFLHGLRLGPRWQPIEPYLFVRPHDRTYIQRRKIYEHQTAHAVHTLHGLRYASAQSHYQDLAWWLTPAGGPTRTELTHPQQAQDRAVRPGEARLLAALQEAIPAVAPGSETIPYVRRLQYSLLGGAVLVLLTTLLFVVEPSHATTAWGTAKFLFRDVGLAAGCGLLASLIPLGTLRASFLYGLTMSLALALVVVTIAH